MKLRIQHKATTAQKPLYKAMELKTGIQLFFIWEKTGTNLEIIISKILKGNLKGIHQKYKIILTIVNKR